MKHTKRAVQPRDRILTNEVRAIKRLEKDVTAHGKRKLAAIIEIGKRLERVKDRVGHGNWLAWLKRNFKWSGDTAERYMGTWRISQTLEFRRLRNLPLEALYLLARKSTPEEARITVSKLIETGVKVGKPEVQVILQQPVPYTPGPTKTITLKTP